jgi:hypothetical protein
LEHRLNNSRFQNPDNTTCVVTISIVTLLVHGLLLLNQGVYWDGRLWYDLIRRDDFDTLWWSLDQAKIHSFYYLASFLKKIGPVLFLFKLITFLSLLTIGLSFFFWLQKTLQASKIQSLLGSITAISAPIALIHVEICLVHYYMFMAVFMAGHTLFSFSLSSEHFSTLNKIVLNFSAFLLIYLSFSYPSLLCIHYGFLSFLFVKNSRKMLNSRESLIFVGIAAVFPVYAYLSRDQAFGLYAGYNQGSELGIHLLSPTINNSFSYFFDRLLLPLEIEDSGDFFGTIICIAMLTLSFLFLYFKKIEKKEKKEKYAWLLIYIICTAGLIILCVFPYIYVGKTPEHQAWKQRNGIPLLLAIPIGFLTFDYFSSILSRHSQLLFRAMVLIYIGLCFQTHVRNYVAWDLDWFKQIKMTQAIKNQVDQSQCNQIRIIDKSRHLNALGRHYAGYDWNSILSEAYNNRASVAGPTWDDRTLIQTPKLPKGLNDTDLINLRKFYLSEDFKSENGGRCTFTVESRIASADKFNLGTYVKLKLIQLFDKENLIKSEDFHLATSVEYEKL